MPRSALQLPELWLMRGRFPARVWRPSPGPPLPTQSRLADSGGSGEPAASGNHESRLWDRCAFFILGYSDASSTKRGPASFHQYGAGGGRSQIQFLLGHVVETNERYLGCKQRLRGAVNDHI